MSRRRSNSLKRRVSFPGKTKLGVTFGKGKNANVVKTIADGGLFADKGVEVGWSIVKVNRTSVDHKSAHNALKKALKRDGNVKLEFEVPVKAGAGTLNIMFDGKKKCGFTLEPKSTIIKSVEKRSAAGKGGVQKGWSVVAVDAVMVDEKNIRSELKRVSKSQRKYQVIFGSPQKKNRNKMLMSIQTSPGESKDNDQELKAQEEAEQKAKTEAEENAKLEAEQKAMEVAEQKAKEEAEQKAREEAEQKAKEEAEQKAREEAEQKEKEEAEQRAREEAERRAREEEEKLAKEEAEKKAKEEADQKERDEAEQRARDEAERKAKEDAEQRAREEAEQRAKEEAEQRAKQEAEQKAKKESEQKDREEAEKKAKEAEQKAQDKAEKKAIEESEQKEKEEAERKAQEEVEDRAQDDVEMKAKEQAEQNKGLDAEPVADKEEHKPSSESKPLASKKVEEKAEGAETALPEAEVKSVPQAQVEVEPRPETNEDQPTASDGLGTAAAAEVPTLEQKAEDVPKDDDVVKEMTTVTEGDVVEDIKQTDQASVHDTAMKDKPLPAEGEEASKETLPSAEDADQSEVATHAQPKAQTECKESPSGKPVEKDDITDIKVEPVAESEIAKSSIPIEETEMKSQESDQIEADKLELGENNKINSKHTEEKDLPVATAAPVVSET